MSKQEISGAWENTTDYLDNFTDNSERLVDNPTSIISMTQNWDKTFRGVIFFPLTHVKSTLFEYLLDKISSIFL